MSIIKKTYLLIVSLMLFASAIMMEQYYLYGHPELRLVAKFQSSFLTQIGKLDKYLDEINKLAITEGLNTQHRFDIKKLQPNFDEEGLGVVVLDGSKMVFWSSSQFAFPDSCFKNCNDGQLLTLPNGIYFSRHYDTEKYHIIGLVHLKNKYPFENQYLKNDFVKPFKIPSGFQINMVPGNKSLAIVNPEGSPVFYFRTNIPIRCNYEQLYFPAFLYLLGLLFLLLFVRQKMREYKEVFILKMFFLAGALFTFYWLHVLMGIPALLKTFTIFSANYYASSDWIPSLGDFVLLATLFFFWSINFVKEFRFSIQKNRTTLFTAYLFVLLIYLLCEKMISNLVFNSNVSFKLYRISDFNFYGFAAYISIAMFMFSAFLIHLKIVDATWLFIRRKYVLSISGSLALISVLASFLFQHPTVYIISLFLLVCFLLFLLKKRHTKRFSFAHLVLFVAGFSIFSVFILYNHAQTRDFQIQKLLAVTLSSEHDPIAESSLPDIQKRINKDPMVHLLFTLSYDELEGYLIRNYFSSYFSRYDLQTTYCTKTDSVLVQPDDKMEPCFPFFDDLINKRGTLLPGCDFYHMKNMNGQTSYLGRLHYPAIYDSPEFTIYIDLNSKIVSEGIGFPELVMDQTLIKPDKYKDFSHAKYFNNELVHRNGDYLYKTYFLSYNFPSSTKESIVVKQDGYDHLIYQLGKNNYVVVSNKSLNATDFLISFPYIFVFYMIFALIFIFIGNAAYRKQAVPYDLKFRIQASIISVVLISLIVVAAGTLTYNIREYQNRHEDDLNEKMRSISEEISNRLYEYKQITPNLQSWLLRELHKLSNIFSTDINIYSVTGEMIATSRPEIFNKGIITPRMNSVAYYELSENYLINYSQPEHIGGLSYLSAYEPIINNKGEYLGFLNLPYFTREDNLNQEISTFIVAFINLYVLLFLASVIVAVLLANQITRPLRLIREKLKGIQLGKKSEQINYSGDDEIGSLVKEYNKKVDELAESADLLAKSEREIAWREMAKQIAHEIKNPLTPMKLQVQYLQRAKDEGKEVDDKHFNKITKTLIEQIDTLSDIATEFSTFAKMPKAINEVLNLVERLKIVEELFEGNPKISISLELNGIVNLPIYADHEQVSSALINLIKNGIQAIPENRDGQITISLKRKGSKAIISVADNGTGIKEEVRERMFEPNFTTKTSGMGLGLAIVKNIVDNFHGRIWYETEMEKGSTFYIEIPVYTKKVSN